MVKLIGRVVAAAWLCTACVSCTGDAPTSALYPVQGKITYKGEPAEGAIVSLQPDGDAPLTKQGNSIVPMGIAGVDGSFSISCSGLGDGAPAGKYKVLITWRPNSKIPAAKKLITSKKKRSTDYDPDALMPADAFNGKYSNPAKPLYNTEVKAESNQLDVDLKD